MKQEGSKFLFLMISITIIGLIILLAILFSLSPYQKNNNLNIVNIIIFYFGQFIFFAGFFISIFFMFKNKSKLRKDTYEIAIISIRQGCLMGILISVLFIMQSLHLLIWWDILLIMVAIMLVEMYLSVK